jgi:hypothetical protein
MFLPGARVPGKNLIHDQDPMFSKAFIAILKAGGVKSVKIPARSPNCNRSCLGGLLHDYYREAA